MRHALLAADWYLNQAIHIFITSEEVSFRAYIRHL